MVRRHNELEPAVLNRPNTAQRRKQHLRSWVKDRPHLDFGFALVSLWRRNEADDVAWVATKSHRERALHQLQIRRTLPTGTFTPKPAKVARLFPKKARAIFRNRTLPLQWLPAVPRHLLADEYDVVGHVSPVPFVALLCGRGRARRTDDVQTSGMMVWIGLAMHSSSVRTQTNPFLLK